MENFTFCAVMRNKVLLIWKYSIISKKINKLYQKQEGFYQED